MDRYKYNNNLSNKLNLVLFTSINSNIKIKNDPIPYLLTNYSEIEAFFELKNETKILYFNMKSIHPILYEYDKVIKIKESEDNQSSNFYLLLLIKSESDLINYEYSIKYINIFNKNFKNNNQNNYYIIIKSKIIIELINNFKNGNSFEESIDGDFVSKLEKECKENIIKNIDIFKEINLNLNENDILDKNIDDLYIIIIIGVVKSNKLCDYDFCYNIFEQLDLENIDLPFMESENLFDEVLGAINLNNEYIKDYIINNFDDLNDMKKVNFLFMLLKYIFKSTLYIYHVPLLYESRKNILELIKSKKYFQFKISGQIFIERIEYIIKKLCDSDYIYLKYLEKNKNPNKNNDNVKLNIIKDSLVIFFISILAKKNPVIKTIDCIYEENKKICYDEMEKLLEIKNGENISELNENYFLYLNCINNYQKIIENNISDYQFNHNFKLYFKFQKSKTLDKTFNLNVEYNISDYPFLEIYTKYSDENILSKKPDELEGFNSLMDRLRLRNYQKFESSLDKPTFVATKMFQKNMNVQNNRSNESISSLFDESELNVIHFEKIIYKHENSVKFFLSLYNEYYLSCGNDELMILYDRNLKILKKINNLEEILYSITLKSNNKNNIELIACYGKNIYLMTIAKNKDYKFDTKKYEIPNIKTLYSVKMLGKDYIITGINIAMKIIDSFNDNIDEKKMFKFSSESFKNGFVINKDYVALISNELIPNGSNKLIIINSNENKIEHVISGYSFNLFNNSIALIKTKNNNILLVACKKYISGQKNGILVVDMNLSEDENIKFKFYETFDFEVYCFCQILDTNYFFVGGFSLDKRIGMIYLYKVTNKNIEIIYVQDIEIFDYNNNFNGFIMPVNTIYQTEDYGKIVITTLDGTIYLFSKPNLDFYIRRQKE